jgi:hypothetical protein
VTVTISTVRSERPRATVLSSTGSTGWFHISRTLLRKVALWHRGASYTWTTEISSASSVTARRGTVVLRGTC